MAHPPRRSPARFVVRSVSVLGMGAASIALTMALLGEVASRAPKMMSSKESEPVLLAPLATRSIVYDASGGEMALLFAEEDRQEVPLSTVPELVQTAILTIEDAEFYIHKGFNLRSGARALFADIGAGEVEQGGSTITQQLIKNSVTGSHQTIERKLNEAVLAVRLEKQMTKRQILERYLNTVYLGHGAYGLQAGAETYFNKGVADLQWPEAALLASLIRNPVGYDPIAFPDLSRSRRHVIAKRLLDEKVIDDVQALTIEATPIPTQIYERSLSTASAQLVGGGYFSETVKQFMLSLPELGATYQERYEAVFEGGLRVYTTYNPDAQRAAEQAVELVPDSDGRFFTGLASLDPRSGAVRAMVGGPDFDTVKTNYVTQGWRQPGSTFKFFVLMAAFERGYVPNDTISGVTPCRFPDPSEPDGIYQASGGGKIATITSQTASSSNCAFLRLGQTVGLDRVAAMATSMGVSTVETDTDANGVPSLREVPVPADVNSLPLGTKEVHPMMMAAAYATAANDGVYNPPYYVEKITDAKGTVLYQHQAAGVRVVSPETARLVTDVLVNNVKYGTGRRARLDNQMSAGKTGTTQDNADAWFVGFTPYLTTAVWLGSPTNRDRLVLRGSTVYGADYPARVWGDFMESYHSGLPPVDFVEPESTRSGRSIRYRNKYDSGYARPATTPTTTVPGTPTIPGTPGLPGTPGVPVTAAPGDGAPATTAAR